MYFNYSRYLRALQCGTGKIIWKHKPPAPGHNSIERMLINKTMEGIIMNQTIHCSVATCRHHNAKNVCELEAIDVRPNCNCHSGKCDESMCGSYDKK